jgi:hypothetical protein
VAGVIIASISAVIALISLSIAWRSSRTARAALAETRRNNQALHAQRSRDDASRVYDDAVRLIESLVRDLPLAPDRVEPLREALRRSSRVAGITTPEITELLGAHAPLPDRRAEEIKAQLLARVDRWNWEIGQRQVMGLTERGSR